MPAEKLNIQENEPKETPEQEETGNQLKRMASDMENAGARVDKDMLTETGPAGLEQPGSQEKPIIEGKETYPKEESPERELDIKEVELRYFERLKKLDEVKKEIYTDYGIDIRDIWMTDINIKEEKQIFSKYSFKRQQKSEIESLISAFSDKKKEIEEQYERDFKIAAMRRKYKSKIEKI
jgi:hypothetical protein